MKDETKLLKQQNELLKGMIITMAEILNKKELLWK